MPGNGTGKVVNKPASLTLSLGAHQNCPVLLCVSCPSGVGSKISKIFYKVCLGLGDGLVSYVLSLRAQAAKLDPQTPSTN